MNNMTYNEQLLDDRWLQKRSEILSRDNYSCQKCDNESYRNNVSIGLVVSNSLDFIGQTHFALGKWRFLVWNLLDNTVFRGGVDDSVFSPEKSYVCYYHHDFVNGLWRNLILGLKEIPNSEIRIRDVDLIDRITENNYKELVEQPTFDLLYSSVIEPGTWSITLGLQVHHKYYGNGQYAWEYPNEALITLCPACHKEIHRTMEIPILNESGREMEKVSSSDALNISRRIRRRIRNN